MAYDLPESTRKLQQELREFVDTELIPLEVEVEMAGGEIPYEKRKRHYQIAKEKGWFSPDIPKELGGGGKTMLDQVIMSEQIGRVTNSLGWCFPMPARWMTNVATPYTMEKFVGPIIRNESKECYAITEEFAGSDVDAITSTAKREGNEYVLNGKKWHVTSANLANLIVFQAKIVGGKNEGAHALFWVPKDTPGIIVERNPLYSHNIPDHHPIYEFRDVRIPVENIIGEEGGGMDFTYDWFQYERMMIGARCCGAASRLIEEATAFAKERKAFGEPIGNFQAIKFPLADSMTELWAGRLMVYQLAKSIDQGTDRKIVHAQSSMVKLYCSEMAFRIADRAVQIFGGRGYMRENVAERFFRETRVDRIWEGTSEIQRDIIGHCLYKRGLETHIS